ncbi:MAG TPA: cobalt ECF transporter T component CbiQ [Atribacter sp.]|jgi:energy-coupling factor transport system permease protein|uniref:cobalt ECF transporter T component CbiQ n=1 Tax=Atribacter sp. TaxID=2847780 RepID=UPI002D018527|nr:cobalt ECF transporter T component CbiQ [Atribacter sp.]HQK84060.1 cobalt ECF transporter T component CbiQ [Atribacter sp.]
MLGKSIAIGQFIPIESPVHRLDPRVKILVSAILIVALFIVKEWPSFLFIGCFIILLTITARIPISYIGKSLKPILFLLAFTLVLQVFFTPGDYIWEYGFLHVSREGLIRGLFIIVRLCLLILCTALLTLTTSPVELTDGLESLMSPFKKWGFPAHELAMMMTIAIRFIPTLMEEADRIIKAQQARGADFESGSLIQRAKNLIPLLVPLFINSFKRADDLAIAMESRCYRGGIGRSRLRVLKLRMADILFFSITIIFITVVILLSWFIW